MVIDQQTVLRDSIVGRDIARQARVLQAQIQKEIQDEQNSILKQEADLKKHASLYSPAQRAQKVKALEARQRAFPQFQDRERRILQVSLQTASDKVATALRPILKQMMAEHKANLLLDRSAVMYAAPGFDATKEAIQRLNAKLTTVKVVRVNLDQAPGSEPEPADVAEPKSVQLTPPSRGKVPGALKLPAEVTR
jgi:outer membrane protein